MSRHPEKTGNDHPGIHQQGERTMSNPVTSHRGFLAPLLGVVFSALALQGCSLIYKTTGDILIHYGQDEMVADMMADDDVAMGCALGESMTPLLMSFERVGSKPDKLGVLVYVTASTCAEEKALEEELRYSRALQAGNVSEARDARTNQKRYHALAAKRQQESYRRLSQVYRKMEDDTCPRLRSDFDELVWMVGLIGGVQAVLNDGAADGSVGVPRNVPAQVVRGTRCLDNDKWWGVPEGVRAALWSILPALGPEDVDAWTMLERAEQTGFDEGVRLGSALYAQAAYTQANDERLREAIRGFVNYDGAVHPDYRMLDAIAHHMVRSLSDRLWTEETGQRTPFGKLGEFWDDEDEEDDLDIEGLL